MTDKIEEYRQKVAGTNIDPKSLLSTDYFNTFNSVVMVLDMVADMPELMEEIEQWQFLDYREHFHASGLDFAKLAIEVYDYAPIELRQALEEKSIVMKDMVEESGRVLRRHLDAGEMNIFAEKAHMAAEQLRTMMEEGNGIIHGDNKSSQSDIDTMFDGAPAPAQKQSDIDSMFDVAPAPAQTQSNIDSMFESKPAEAALDIDAMFSNNAGTATT